MSYNSSDDLSYGYSDENLFGRDQTKNYRRDYERDLDYPKSKQPTKKPRAHLQEELKTQEAAKAKKKEDEDRKASAKRDMTEKLKKTKLNEKKQAYDQAGKPERMSDNSDYGSSYDPVFELD